MSLEHGEADTAIRYLWLSRDARERDVVAAFLSLPFVFSARALPRYHSTCFMLIWLDGTILEFSIKLLS